MQATVAPVQTSLEFAAAHYRELVDAAPDIIWSIDLQGIFTFVNPAVQRLLGYAPSEVIGQHFTAFQPPDAAAPELLCCLAAWPQTVCQSTAVYRTRDDRALTLTFRATPLIDSAGMRVGTTGTATEMPLLSQPSRLEATLEKLALSTAAGEELLKSLVRYLAELLEVDHACVGQLNPDTPGWAQTIALFVKGKFVENIAYDLTHTPCEQVAHNQISFYPCAVQQQFPSDPWLVENNIESYVGIPLLDSRGQMIGTLAALSERPLHDSPEFRKILQIFAVQAASELERLQSEIALKRLNEELEARVEQRTAELENTVAQLQQEIGQRQRSEQALRQSEKLYRTLIENFPDGAVILFDADLRYTIADGAGLTQVGLSRRQLEGKTVWEIFPPEICHTLEPQYRQTLAGKRLSCEVTYCDRLYLVQTLPVRNEQGEIFAGMVLTQDTTEQQQQAIALRASEQKFRSLYEHMQDAVSLFDGAGFVDCNPATLELFGCDRKDQFCGHHPGYFSPELQPSGQPSTELILHLLASAWQGGNPVFEWRCRRLNGSEFLAEISLNLVEIGGQSLIQAIVRDITQRHQAEAALRQSEENFRQLAATIQEVFFLSTIQGEVLYISPGYETIWGYSCQSLRDVPRAWLETIHPEDRARVVSAFEEQVRNCTDRYTIEYRILRADGSLRWIRTQVSTVFDVNGKPSRLAGVAEDITDRKMAEQQLQSSLEEKELLLKEVHHRVKNNLQVVCSIFSLQAQYIEDPKILGILVESQNRINAMALIHEKLYQSSNLAQINFTDYIRNLTSGLFASYSTQASRVTLRLHVNVNSLNLDTAIRCGLIINELMSNALKYAFPNGRSGEVSLGVQAISADQICLTVQDDGVGLPPGLDLSQTNSLGLRLVRILTRKLKGTLEIRPTDPQNQLGTRFCIAFPLRSESFTN
jgi:PAS domain S-box-containing protein